MRKAFLILAVLALVACTPVALNNNTSNISLVNGSFTPQGPSEPTMEDANEGTMTDQNGNAGDFAAHLSFTEGDLIKLKSYAVDPDNDDVELSFSKPFDRNGVWKTAVGDAGDYPVTVVARDSKGAQTETRILVTVQFANRPPVLAGPDSLTVKEGDIIILDFSASDPDGDEAILSYSGWMKGPEYTTTYADAGVHNVTVTAEDGKLTTKKVVSITVQNTNRPPSIITLQDRYDTTELQEVQVVARANDPDGDKVTLTYGAPLDAQGRWTPVLDQAGDYTATVSASDGVDTVTKDIAIHVNAANRPPRIILPGEDGVLRFKEGDFIDIRSHIQYVDPENEEIAVTYSGWMHTSTYQTTYDDAGSHVVSIRAADSGNHTSTADVTIIVEDVNRPPVFVRPA